MGNPFLNDQNALIDFEQVTSNGISEATDKVIRQAEKDLHEIIEKKGDRSFENTAVRFDHIHDHLNTVISTIHLLAYVHPEENIRNQCHESFNVLSKYVNKLSLNEGLYNAFKEYSKSPELLNQDKKRKRFIKKEVEDFERNGFKLDKDQRDILISVKDNISETAMLFNKNIAECNDFLIVGEEEMHGLPEDYKNEHREEKGRYKIDLSYPSYIPFMKYSKSGQARKKLLLKYLNRASDQNLDVLQQILVERKKLSNLLGYSTYASYALEDKMAKKPAEVWKFEEELVEQVKKKARKDYSELLSEKRKDTGNHREDTIHLWESSYYNNILLKEKYKLDQEELKSYFSLDNVIDGIFHISREIFGITIEKEENAKVWHEEVRLYKVKEGQKTTGYFYLDLHPRKNKYSHAACFSLVNGCTGKGRFQIPTATLVCNFPRGTKDKPSLIPHGDVVTIFHEFGHLLHHLFARTELSMQAGISNSRDFVEVPSQCFENWAWNYESLKYFARHYETNEPLPEDLYKRMMESRNVGSGLHTLQQIYYGMLDMTFHDKYDPEGNVSSTDIVKDLQNKITLYPYVEGTRMHASFGHLTGYAAGYYGYLWAKVYAEDIFSVFDQEGILDKKTGLRFKKEILSKGSTFDEMELVTNFLGRMPDKTAFYKSIGLSFA